jgi:VWFA-related protein
LKAQTPGEPAVPTTVRIGFTVFDKDDNAFSPLSKEDLRISEDDKPQQIIALERQVEAPVSLSFLIDMSVSQERVIPAARAAALSFVNVALRQGKDEVALATFTGALVVEQPLTGDLNAAKSAIQRLQFVPRPQSARIVVGNPPVSNNDDALLASTAIWDALWETCDRVFSQPNSKSRRAIILVTDGVDTSSQRKMADAVERAIASNVAVYVIGMGDVDNFAGIDQGVIKKISERTGGRSFFPKKVNELQAALARIRQDLQYRYVIAYSSANKNPNRSFRKVEIEIINPEKKKDKLKLAYPRGYSPGSP